MAERKIIQHADGTATEISDSYAFGTINVGPPVKTEDPSRYEIRMKREDEYLRERKWTRAFLDEAIAYCGHPPGQLRQWPKLFSWTVERCRVFRESDIAQWEQRIKSLELTK